MLYAYRCALNLLVRIHLKPIHILSFVFLSVEKLRVGTVILIPTARIYCEQWQNWFSAQSSIVYLTLSVINCVISPAMSHFEELLQCPYNRSHRILPHAMQRHMFKCRKNNASKKLVSCPFNTIHLVPGPELKLHLVSCPDRATFDLYKYCIASGPSSSNSSYKNDEPELIYHDSISTQGPGKSLQDDDECWDDSAVPAYNPQKYCKSAKIIRKATLLRPSDKQKFYRQEHQRHRELDSDRKQSKPQTNRKKDHIPLDRSSFKDFRGPVTESEYSSEEPKMAPEKTLQDDGKGRDRPLQKKQDTHQQEVGSVGNDIDEISAQFSKKISVGCK